MSKLNPTIHQQDGVSAQTFAVSSGLSVVKVLSLCRRGRIIRQRAREAHYLMVLTATQMKYAQEALRLAIEDTIEAMSDEPGGMRYSRTSTPTTRFMPP